MDNIKSKSPQLSKKNIKCSTHPTKKECDKYDCLWGKTGKCSKKRIPGKLKQRHQRPRHQMPRHQRPRHQRPRHQRLLRQRPRHQRPRHHLI